MSIDTIAPTTAWTITSFRGEFSALSNFDGRRFAMPGDTIPATAEHHFQAYKTTNMREREWIYAAPTAKYDTTISQQHAQNPKGLIAMFQLHDTFNPDADSTLIDVFDEDGNLIESQFVALSGYVEEFSDEKLDALV